jgi:hypothetical protein
VNIVLALDPGLTHPGVAYHLNGRLVRADRLKIPKVWAELDILDRCDHVAEAAFEWFSQFFMRALPGDICNTTTMVAEFPQWYGKDQKGIDPNDLAGLCAIAGALTGRLRTYVGDRVIVVKSPKPREVWGTVPKTTKGDPWKSPRGARLASRLTPDERLVVANYHDALDAAGLALWGAGRWKPHSNYPGAV